MYLYRYHGSRYCYDYDDIHYEVICHEYKVIKETPHGYWIKDKGAKRWVNKTGKKIFAHAAKQDALASFIYRTKKWRAHINGLQKSIAKWLEIAGKGIVIDEHQTLS